MLNVKKNSQTALKFLFRAAIASLAALMAAGCSGSEEKQQQRVVFTTILPQKDFVQRVAADRFEVNALVGPGQSPHDFIVTPEQMVRLSQAEIFFRIGVEAEEGFLPRIIASNPGLKIADLREGVRMRDIEQPCEHDGHHHSHDDNHRDKHHHYHNHGSKDPHIWLSPVTVKQIAMTIKNTLVEQDPEGEQIYARNLASFIDELDSLDTFLRRVFAPYKGRYLFVFHPAFGYFADEYGLKQMAIETGGKEPSARALTRLLDLAKEHNPGVIFVQPQYSEKSARAIAEQIGCAVVTINPLPENYIKEMRTMAEAIRESFEQKK